MPIPYFQNNNNCNTETKLLRLALDLGACDFGGDLSTDELAISEVVLQSETATAKSVITSVKQQIADGSDPLGEQFCWLRTPAVRRRDGAIYTPPELVNPMVSWALNEQPERIIDAGAGSGRFTLRVARETKTTQLVAIDSDPVATLMTRGGLAALKHQKSLVLNTDYTTLSLPEIRGRTAFIGNPPYVRHHSLPATVKAWAQMTASRLGQSVSGLAGLHAYFFLATAHLGRPGDVGCFVTSAEWLDVNYGSIVRNLLLGVLGGEAIHVLAPDSLPFGETATTAAITCFRIGEQRDTIRFRPVSSLAQVGNLCTSGVSVSHDLLASKPRWSTLVKTRSPAVSEGYIELGELFRVHRGAVTGSNATWVTKPGLVELPESVLFSAVTRAKELFEAGLALDKTDQLKLVIDIPQDLHVFDAADRKKIDAFLCRARNAGVHNGYIASHRGGKSKAWWAVGLRDPAPILATYMARRPPAFVQNLCDARHINIAHGLYPREALPARALQKIVNVLTTSITVAQGRTYAGGLTKFEPKEMERLPIPDLKTLLAS